MQRALTPEPTPQPSLDTPLYPPTVRPPDRDLPFLFYVAKLVANPLRVMPKAVYTDPIVAYSFLNTHLFWVTAPELIERVLLEETGRYVKSPLERRVLGPTLGDGMLTAQMDTWRWQRKVASPLFRHADLLAFVPAMAAAAETQIARWREHSGGSAPFTADAEAAMMTVTFDIIATTVLAGCEPAEGVAIKRADTAYMDPISWEITAAVLKLPGWVWHPAQRQMREAASTLRGAVATIIERRRGEIGSAMGAPADDLLARLLAARDPETGAPMSDTMMVDNLTTFLEAGHQTTAQALSWALYLLARAPAWQDAARAEIANAVGEEAIEGRHVASLPVTLRIFKEAMRLYPPVPAILRLAKEADQLGDEAIPAGAIVIIPVYAAHRHHARWDDPDRFDPDRFLPDREQERPRAQYLPFGFGPRTCLGMPFAYLEGVAILASVLRRCRFSWDGRHVPEPLSQITLHPKGGMPLKVELI